MAKRPLREATASPPLSKSVKQEYAVVNFLNEEFEKAKRTDPAYDAEAVHVGGNKPYDLRIEGSNIPPVASVKLVAANYEVKEDTGSGNDLVLAKLGSEKAKAVLASNLFRSIVFLGSQIQSKWKGVAAEAKKNGSSALLRELEYFVSKDDDGSLIRYEQMLGLELSSAIFRDIKIGTLRDNVEKLRGELSKTVAVGSVSTSEETVELSYSQTQKKGGKKSQVVLGDVPAAILPRIAAIAAKSSSGASNPKLPESTDLLIALEEFLERYPETSAVEAEIIKVTKDSLIGIHGFFGVRGTEIYYTDSAKLIARGMTQGGRLVLGTPDGTLLTSNATLPAAAPQKSNKMSATKSRGVLSLSPGAEFSEIEEWYDTYVNTTSKPARVGLFKSAVGSHISQTAPLPSGEDIDTKRKFTRRVFRTLNLENKRLSLPPINETTRESNLLLAELFPPRSPSLLTELALYESTGVLNEGVKEKAMDVVQYLVGAAAEYGVAVPTAGAGAPFGMAAETIIDAVFSVESIASAVTAIEGAAKEAEEFKDILNRAMAAKDKIKSDLGEFYNEVRDILRFGLDKLGEGARAKMKELAEKLKTVVDKMVTKISDAVGDAIKFLIPEATLGTAVGEIVQASLEKAGESGYDMIKGALEKAGKYKDLVTDPNKFVDFLSDAIDKLLKFMAETAKKLEDTSLFKAVISGGATGALVKQLGPKGLRKLSTMIEEKKPKLLALAKSVTSVLIPAVFTLLALGQILLKGEFMPEKEGGEGEAPAEAPGEKKEVPKESRLRRGRVFSETRLLLRELGV